MVLVLLTRSSPLVIPTCIITRLARHYMNYTKIHESHPKIDVSGGGISRFAKETQALSRPDTELLIEARSLLPHFQCEL